MAMSLGFSALASAAPVSFTYTTSGATVCAAGPATPCTLTSTDATFSLLRLVLDSPIQFSDLTDLTTAYTANLGGIGGGSPRWAVVIDTNNDNVSDGSFLIHWGPAGSFTDATLGAGNTGNLLAAFDNGRYDLGGFGGSAYTDRAAALTLAGTFASFNVLRLSLIIDSFGGNDREFVFGADAFTVGGQAAVPEPATLMLLGTGLFSLGFASRKRLF